VLDKRGRPQVEVLKILHKRVQQNDFAPWCNNYINRLFRVLGGHHKASQSWISEPFFFGIYNSTGLGVGRVFDL